MTFAALVLTEFFKAYNYRSDRISVFHRPFANTWLNIAIVWELALMACVIYVPFLQRPFSTFPLTLEDWVIVTVLAATVVPVLETVKALQRRGYLGAEKK